ncbi:MAG: hypothetical protein U0263_40915 [Polyangiaceae bacterium]
MAVAQTGSFISVDGQNTPDSEARLVWSDGKLYLLLYAADQDIRASVKAHDAPLWPEEMRSSSFPAAWRAGKSSHLRVAHRHGHRQDRRKPRFGTSWVRRASGSRPGRYGR